jgi:arginine decarboxylase
MSAIVPTKVFLTRGKGQHREKLVSFEKALREAGISPFNLVRVSSIFPPRCRLISREEGVELLKPGQILFVVLSENATAESHQLISASIGLALANDPARFGYLAEHEALGQSEGEAGDHTEYLAAEMLATKMDQNLEEGEKGRRTYRTTKGLILKTRSLSQTAVGESGLWTTALAAAVLIA